MKKIVTVNVMSAGETVRTFVFKNDYIARTFVKTANRLELGFEFDKIETEFHFDDVADAMKDIFALSMSVDADAE